MRIGRLIVEICQLIIICHWNKILQGCMCWTERAFLNKSSSNETLCYNDIIRKLRRKLKTCVERRFNWRTSVREVIGASWILSSFLKIKLFSSLRTLIIPTKKIYCVSTVNFLSHNYDTHVFLWFVKGLKFSCKAFCQFVITWKFVWETLEYIANGALLLKAFKEDIAKRLVHRRFTTVQKTGVNNFWWS